MNTLVPLLPVETTACIELGIIQRGQGLRGNLVVKLNHDSPHLDSLSSLVVKIDHTLVPYRIEQFFWRQHKVILKLQGVDDPDTAHYLRGRPILVPRVMLSRLFPQATSLYSLLDYYVIDTRAGSLGTVHNVHTLSQQKRLVIDYQEQELLVPYHEDIVTHIDHVQRTIMVRLPDGFMEAMY